MRDLTHNIAQLTEYMVKRGVKADPSPKVKLRRTIQEGPSISITTGHYDPDTHEIVLYVAGRHDKDILRSYAHELIHHDQNMRGLMRGSIATPTGYAQVDPHLRKLEMDAYLRGNMLFRDWCDSQR